MFLFHPSCTVLISTAVLVLMLLPTTMFADEPAPEHTPQEEAGFRDLFEDELEEIAVFIKFYPNFPKDGVLFQDVNPLLQDAEAFHMCISLLAEWYKTADIDGIVGVESRGFIFGAALAYSLQVPFIPARKEGKLPGKFYTVSYEKEYGTDALCLAADALEPGQRVVVMDDVIATGGSAAATVELVKKAGGVPVECAFILEVPELSGRAALPVPSFVLIEQNLLERPSFPKDKEPSE